MDATRTPPATNPQGSSMSKDEKDIQKMIKQYSDETTFAHINTVSTISYKDLAEIRDTYNIPSTYDIRPALHLERMYHRPDKWTAVSLYALKYGVRFPLHPFIVTLLSFIGVGFAQLVPNSYIHIIAFIAFCHEFGITPTIDRFFSVFYTSQSREAGFRQLSRQVRKSLEKRPLMRPPTSNKGWHPLWFFVKGPSFREVLGWCEASHVNVTTGEHSEARMLELVRFLCRCYRKGNGTSNS